MKKLLEHMGPVFKNWADRYFQSEIAIQFDDFQKKNPEESVKCDLESFQQKLLAYHIFKGHYINTQYFTKDISINVSISNQPVNDKIFLGKEGINFIDQMQNDEDFGLDCYQQAISEAVCFLGSILYTLNDGKEKDNAIKHIESLSLTRERMEALRKQ